MSEEDNKESVVSRQASDKKPESSSFWAELKRRKVMRVAITYAVVAWLIMQVAGLTFEGFGVPIWAFRFVVIVLWLFFPVAIILTWAFELTPEGIKTTKSARETQGDEPVSKKVQRKRNWMALGFAAAVPTVVFGALALFFFVQNRSLVSDSEPTPEAPAFEVEENEKSIAVLPLENMSPDPDNAFFADGVQEDILTNLSKIEELGVVISRSSTLKYRDPNRNLKQVGDELGVRYIVEGSVRRAANQVLVTVQLIDSQTDDHIWAENYNRELSDIFAIQAEVAKEIAGQLRAAISPEEIAKIEYRPTQNQEAYDYFLKHRRLLQASGNNWDQKIELLEMAVALDPEFAEAWAHLSVEYLFDGGRDNPERVAKSREALQTARSLDPVNAYIPWAQSYYENRVNRDLKESIVYLLEALDIDPGFTLARRPLGRQYYEQGLLIDSQKQFEEYLRSDPLGFIVEALLIHVYQRQRNWEKARELITKRYQRTGDRRMLVELQYLQSGDKQTFIQDMVKLPGFMGDAYGKLWSALQERNFEDAKNHVENLVNDRFEFLSSGYDIQIVPSSLMAGLMAFEEGGIEDWASEAVELREKIESGSLYLGSNYWSTLAICHAFTGERSATVLAIETSRHPDEMRGRPYGNKVEAEVLNAIAYLILGENENALSTLEEAAKLESITFLNRELDLWFIFDRLRGNPRFDALLEG